MNEPDPTNPDPVAYYLEKIRTMKATAKQVITLNLSIHMEMNQ